MTIKTLALRTLCTLTALFVSVALFAQPMQEKVEMADGLRASGKIYVVVAVLLTVLTGLILYIIRLDGKISKLEKQNHL